MQRLLPIASFAMTAATGCGFNAQDEDTVLRWLTCDKCIAGEREAVSSIGQAAVPYLAGVLDTVPPKILEPLRIRLTNGWSSDVFPDQTEYVSFFIDNASAKARIRAAQSLADLGADDALQQALTNAVNRGMREDIVAALRGALANAAGRSAVGSVTVLPDTLRLAIGESAELSVFERDPFGNLQPPAVTWSSSNPAIASVQGEGAVTAVAIGAATVTARSTVDQSQAGNTAIVVGGPRDVQLTMQAVSGTNQTGASGDSLAMPLRVRVTANGEPVEGVTVIWSVLLGGGSVMPRNNGVTDVDGVATARYDLGSPGPQRVEARAAGAPALVFRATAISP